jgi:hypothetical protein
MDYKLQPGPNAIAATYALDAKLASEFRHLTPGQLARVREIAVGHINNTDGHQPNLAGIANLVRSQVKD